MASTTHSQLTADHVAISAGTQSARGGTLVLSNSNNISFGMSGSTQITASANPGVSALSAGAASVAAGQVVLSNSNGVSFGLNGSTVTGSVAAGATATGNFGGVAGGAATATSGTVVFSNSNGVTFGLNGQTMTASVSRLTGDWWDNAIGGTSSANMSSSSQSLMVFPAMPCGGELMPYDITANTMGLALSMSGSTATMSQAFSSSFYFGVYTSTGATLSLLNSASSTLGFAGAATDNSTAFADQRVLTLNSSQWSSQPVFKRESRYYFAFLFSTAGAQLQTFGMIGQPLYRRDAAGTIGGASAGTTAGPAPFVGKLTATTNAMPASIANTDLNRNAGFAGSAIPYLYICANASLQTF